MKKIFGGSAWLLTAAHLAVCASAGLLQPPGAPGDSETAFYSMADLQERLASGSNNTLQLNAPAGLPADTPDQTLSGLLGLAPSNRSDAVTDSEVLAGRAYWSLASASWGTTTGILLPQAWSDDSPAMLAGFYPPTNLVSVDSGLASSNFVAGLVVFGVTGGLPVRTFGSLTAVLLEGVYPATNLTQVESDLQASNISASVQVFGLPGSALAVGSIAVALPVTGQTNSYLAGDDGTLQRGFRWAASNRFTVYSDLVTSNCVLDHLTGLTWLRKPDTNVYRMAEAITAAEGLDGNQGRGGFTDWRVPNVREMLSLFTPSASAPALPAGHPFYLPSAQWVWTSTTRSVDTTYGLKLVVGTGQIDYGVKSPIARDTAYWAVRGP